VVAAQEVEVKNQSLAEALEKDLVMSVWSGDDIPPKDRVKDIENHTENCCPWRMILKVVADGLIA